jgi:hypothetical protein
MAGCVMEQVTLLERVLALPSVPFAERTKRLPDRPGLYFAIGDDSEILYVGMSRKSIRQRWKTWHGAAIQIAKEGLEARVRIAFVVYRDIDAVRHDERAAIREFRPAMNLTGFPGVLERQQQKAAEECEWIDCDEHSHHRWPPRTTPTKSRPCVCIVHESCGKRSGAAFADARREAEAALKMEPAP